VRRITASVVGTFAGTALLVALKFGDGAPPQVASAAAGGVQPLAQAGTADPSATPVPPSHQPIGQSGAARPRTSKSNRQTASKPTSKPTSKPIRAVPTGTGGGSGLKTGTFAGAASTNQYGTVRVTITVSGGRITDLQATYPTSPSRTAQINARAIPALRQEALSAQSAQVSTVSGASYTSASYRASLQSALSAAKA
jgi:uncharacterized protein with FMN-binding domain